MSPSSSLGISSHFADLILSLSRASAVNSETALSELLEGLARLTKAQDAFALLAKKQSADEACPLGGWRPCEIFFLNPPDAALRAQVERWMTTPDLVASDRFTMSLLSNVGTARALLREQALGGAHWESEPGYQLLKLRGMRDRMVGAAPLSQELELFVGVDRADLRPDFDESARESLQHAMSLLVPLGRSLALSYGLAGTKQALTERERAVLREVLKGKSPGEAAEAAKLSVHTVNDHLKAIYRKFNVRSRAELMALWLTPWNA